MVFRAAWTCFGMQVLAGKGPKLVLDLPAACFQPQLEPSISAIMRHILEDPATLQAAMEAEIRATLSKQKTPPNRTGSPLRLSHHACLCLRSYAILSFQCARTPQIRLQDRIYFRI